MLRTGLLLLAAFAATTALAEGSLPSNTGEARAEAAKRTETANHAAALRSFVPLDSELVSVTDTDSARRAAGQDSARLAHDAYLSYALRAGAGLKPVPITVTDTDSARAAAAQENRELGFLAVYAEYVKMHAKSRLELSSAFGSGHAPADALLSSMVER
jgi:hypothetical protein